MSKSGNDLTAHDKVVRFFPYIVTDGEVNRVQYIALVADPKSGKGNIRKLFSVTTDNLDHYVIKRDRIIDDTLWKEMDSIVWRPIAKDISNAHRVYVIAPGLLNNIPLEYLETVLDKYELHRISSLDVLLNKSTHSKSKKRLALFGDLEYYCLDDKEDEYPLLPLTRGAGIHLERLWGTKVEVEQIHKISNEVNLSSVMYTGCDGTERNLNAILENDKVDALHFATHAFSGEPIITDNTYTLQDYMLSRCGLYLSGAGDIIDDEKRNLLNFEGDGILTGAEIARSDIKNLEFVTLSACNTNAGLTNNLYSITSENSWSLTNAFKIAGTKALLSSLWAVDDEATSYVMMSFYENWFMKKMTLHDALESLQEEQLEIKKVGQIRDIGHRSFCSMEQIRIAITY